MKTPILAVLLTSILSVPAAAPAQTSMPPHGEGMDHATHMMQNGTGAETGTMTGNQPTEPGQSAFAAIQEIVELLDADPRTNWAAVDIEALRRHLIDMSNVTLNARGSAAPTDRGAAFSVTGSGETVASIRRMVAAHAATMNGIGGWTYATEEIPDGAKMTVSVADPADVPKVRALGFIGVMTHGAHHQQHHLMIARGHAPHE